MDNPAIDVLARKIWDYHHLNQQLEKADCILVLGSNDVRVAEWAAKLFLDGYAPFMLFSGSGASHEKDMLETHWSRPEADIFAEIAVGLGVPRNKILMEDQSQNTGENVEFSKKLLLERGLDPNKIMLVQKPYMERRTYATFKKIWPEKEFVVTSPPISFEDYPTDEIPKEKVINLMTGDLQRIKEYPAKGFQIPQEIPPDVWSAYEKLVKLGYDKHMIK